MKNKRLGKRFFQRSALAVAKELLGKELVRVTRQGKISGVIVETEAYGGSEDLACHARFGRTERNKVMFEAGGLAYIYLIYGIYYNLNITTEKKDRPEAVLIRALEPKLGLDLAKKNLEDFGRVRSDRNILTGPGKLCAALEIDKSLYGEDIIHSKALYILDTPAKFDITSSSRIGIDYAGAYAKMPWRFCIKDNIFVSKK